jgi:methionyl-tRNA synthetase
VNPVYITTAIPYINAKPHLGHVLEWFQADALVRFHRLSDKQVFFASGADENSLKNVRAAQKAGKSTQEWLDAYAEVFEAAYGEFGIKLDAFRRSSDQQLHWPGVQELWRRCVASGDIYKKSYKGLYCVGCEAFYTTEELVDGNCPEHLVPPEVVEEENYFFRLSKYQEQILELIKSKKLTIYGSQYEQEMIGFISQGLEDFSVSRSKERARGVGVPIPDDETQIMYVWFDALVVYLTAVGFGTDQELFDQFWRPEAQITHLIGKGINRFHSVYWIGMLLSAGLPLPTTIAVHGYLTAEGQKMSKSLGNVVDPFEIVAKYGLEAVRYYLLKAIPTHADGDFSYARFEEIYTADLANGLGNLASRVATLAANCGVGSVKAPESFEQEFADLMAETSIDAALAWVGELVRAADGYLTETKPWQTEGEEKQRLVGEAVEKVLQIAYHLQPFMPETAEKLLATFSAEKIEKIAPLFPRLS